MEMKLPAPPMKAEPVGRGAKLPVHLPVHTIGQTARLCGLSSRMIRYYEGLGLIGPISRTEGGYRHYGNAHINTLRFIKRARDLGFSLDEIGELVALWQNQTRASASVKRIAQQRVKQLDQRIRDMQGMQRTLQNLLRHCHGDDRPECPILDDLAAPPPS